ncbi:MAG TPA: S8 family serine peptidase [Pyrinomonadaceae bacterium]|nr:S8 family serine peptidase [Pyrinomonadaceae bacterium]
MNQKFLSKTRQLTALALACLLAASQATAGILVRGTQGITMTGIDGITFDQIAGVTVSGVDNVLGLQVNGINVTNSDGVTASGVDGVTASGVDGVAYTGANGVTASGVDGVTASGVDGLLLSGSNGVTVSGVDGTTRMADSVVVRMADGVTVSGVDSMTMYGVEGFRQGVNDGVTASGVDGVTASGVDSIVWRSADQIVARGTDGVPFKVVPDGVTVSGVDNVIMTKVDGVTASGVDAITMRVGDGVTASGVDGSGIQPFGLMAVDPELVITLNKLTDDSNINVVVTYHRPVTETDLAELQRIGITGGTRFRMLPMVIVSGTPDQIAEISRLPTVRYMAQNRTLQWNEDRSRAITGLVRTRTDSELKARTAGLGYTGKGVGVAVIDTGIDSTHSDISGRVVRNVRLADLQGFGVGFSNPVNVEGLANTDIAQGHGTFVAGIIAGNSTRTGGKYSGYAPGANLVGLSAGDVNLFHVLAGFDYLLEKASVLGVRVVNCSFSANITYNENDPVNIATKMLTERGINVVFSAGNSGPGLHSMNPYAAAPWVISVGATDGTGKLASFSSRGDFGSRNFRPTLVAPGVGVVSLRATGGANLTGVTGLASGDTELSLTELPFYTTASGTSFTAPQVAGTIALMLEANPTLTPAQVRDILQRTATPLPPYYQHEAGAGMLNAHAAVLEAAFPTRRIGVWRATSDRSQVRFVKEEAQMLTGTASPGVPHETVVKVSADAVMASAQVAWGPMWGTNDLSMTLYDPNNIQRANANVLNMPGLTGKRERALVRMPLQGRWRVRVSNTLTLVGSPQTYTGLFETARADYAPLVDLIGLHPADYSNIRQAIRMCVAWPVGRNYRPSFGVTRADLAEAMVVGGRVPQYLPGQSNFTDVTDPSTMLFVESAQSAPVGALFPETPKGSAFRPDELVNRALAAVVLVRAAGLESEALKFAGTVPYADAGQIPVGWQGYVMTAIERGLIATEDNAFRPQQPFTRADLARALVRISEIYSE